MEILYGIDMAGPPGWLMAALAGLVFGSFASAMTYRIPRGLSWVSGHSACPSCGHALSVPDLIPFFSWLFLRGRCRHCRAAIGWRYPAIELATLVLCLLVYGAYGFSWAALALMAAMPFLVALVAIDLEHMILPDQLNIILGVLGLVFAAVAAGAGGPLRAAGVALLAGVFYAGLIFAVGWAMSKILRKDALGLGDVKFFEAAGIWLGVAFLPIFLILSGVFGVILGLAWKVFLHKDRFPFGPALIASFIACAVFYAQIQALWPQIF